MRSSVILLSVSVALANDDLNICSRDMFRADFNENYEGLCNNKHLVGEFQFGDELGEGVKTVTETNKAPKHINGNKLRANTNSNSI